MLTYKSSYYHGKVSKALHRPRAGGANLWKVFDKGENSQWCFLQIQEFPNILHTDRSQFIGSGFCAKSNVCHAKKGIWWKTEHCSVGHN